ncbi:aldolase [Bacillus sp. 1P10SD]|uniref:aldolase n=1 Tax=Bacillus sp. 1P10SD TaxID=3132265 RepID=UPI0039A6A9B4
MLKIENKKIYKAFGFSISSEIPFLELHSMEKDNNSDFDIEISINDLTEKWFSVTDNNYGFLMSTNIVMCKFEDFAIFSIEDGRKITVSPLKDFDKDLARLIILGTCMGVILIQRKILPLHGSAVEINGKAYAIVGESGAGKSTLASAFLREGYNLLTDDVISLSLSNENIPLITPSYPSQKLWEDSLNHFGLDKNIYNSLYGRKTKYSVPIVGQYSDKTIPLAGIFELTKTENEKIELVGIKGLEGFQTIYKNTYREFLIPHLGLLDWHFNQSAIILNKVNLYRLSRPISKFSASQLVSTILKTIGDKNDYL